MQIGRRLADQLIEQLQRLIITHRLDIVDDQNMSPLVAIDGVQHGRHADRIVGRGMGKRRGPEGAGQHHAGLFERETQIGDEDVLHIVRPHGQPGDVSASVGQSAAPLPEQGRLAEPGRRLQHGDGVGKPPVQTLPERGAVGDGDGLARRQDLRADQPIVCSRSSVRLHDASLVSRRPTAPPPIVVPAFPRLPGCSQFEAGTLRRSRSPAGT